MPNNAFIRRNRFVCLPCLFISLRRKEVYIAKILPPQTLGRDLNSLVKIRNRSFGVAFIQVDSAAVIVTLRFGWNRQLSKKYATWLIPAVRHTNAGIRRLQDLRGKRVGVPEYQMTPRCGCAAFWRTTRRTT
jgi:hypothetical protein